MISTIKLPMLKKDEYTIWIMRMEQYLANTDYGLWQVIMNGDEPVQTTKDENGVETEVPPKTAQAILERQKEIKAKSIMLLAIPNEYQLRFHTIKDAKSLWAAIKSRFGGNVESKKMQKNILKQQFENFSVSETEGLDKAYDRFQKLISLLEVHGAAVPNEDANQKILRALPSLWNNVALIMRNKDGIDDLDINDLYNNLKKTLAAVIKLILSNSPQLDDEDLEQIDHDNLEEMDLKWQVAMLFMRAKRFYKKTGRKLIFNGKEPVGFDKTKVECFNFHRRGHFAREFRAPRNQRNMNGVAGYRSRDNTRRTVLVETSDALVIQDNALIDLTQSLESVEAQLIVHQKNEAVYEEKITVLEFEVKDKSNAVTRLTNQLEQTLKEKEDLKTKLEQFETSSKNLNKLINSQISSKDKTGLGYGDQLNENDSSGSELFNSVFDSRSSDGDDNQTNDRPTSNKTSASVSQVETSITPPSNTIVEMPRVESVRPSGVIIDDWNNDDDEDIFQSNDVQTIVKPSFKKIKFTKARNEPVKFDKQAVKPRMVTQSPKVDRKDWNHK
ncbi:hypothetical protein Tco_0273385 [Tanacetum coccineum]